MNEKRMSYGAARRAAGVVREAELVLEERASADRVDALRREFDAAVEEHCARFGFDRTEVTR